MTALVIILILLGLLLLAMELFLIPGFGIAGISGIGALVGSVVLSFNKFGYGVGIAVLVGIVALIVIMLLLMMRSKTWKKLSLNTNIDSRVDKSPQGKGLKIGEKGTAITRLAPGGSARFSSTTTEVCTRGQLIETGEEVAITEFDGNRIFVERV